RRASPAPELPDPPSGSLLATIHREDIIDTHPSPDDNNNHKITNCTVLASYNWLNRKSPTITVPGLPPTWTPLSEPIKLQPDAGQYYRDQNAARYPKHPLQPAVEAILRTDPTFDTTDIDLVACTSTLGNLLRFIRKVDKKFRMIVETVGTTVFFIRRENSPTQTISDVRGYGHTFPETYTTWGPAVKGSESHQRVLRYNFFGLTCVVRFEGDGYLPERHTVTSPAKEANTNEPPSQPQTLISLLSSSTLTPHEPKTNNTSPLTIQSTPAPTTLTPQSAIFDLKTRSFYKRDTDILSEEMTRLWISQIPNLILAFHEYGKFTDIRVTDIRDEMQQWEVAEEHSLRQLGSLLKMLSSFALGQPDGRFEIVHEEGKEGLELREVVEGVERVLPGELQERWSKGYADENHDDNDSWTLGLRDERSDSHGLSSDDDNDDDDDNYDNNPWNWTGNDRSDNESAKDFTACSASDCGYCGHCPY
ncbi:hypothetical protein ASPCADRAFT_27028, partial [Aspergillus carbonarius ITEM 5010]